MVSTVIFIGSIVATVIITFLVTIFLSPIKDWINSKEQRQCDYSTPNNRNVETHQIIVKKRFGKTTDINCYWYHRREQKELDEAIYLHCVFGKKFFSQSGKGGAKCPFDIQA